MKWKVVVKRQTLKAIRELDEHILFALRVLIDDLKACGPAPGKHWQNYGKLHGKRQEDNRHCHLFKGNPTFVCCWKVFRKEKIIEVYYVSTHEKAPY